MRRISAKAVPRTVHSSRSARTALRPAQSIADFENAVIVTAHGPGSHGRHHRARAGPGPLRGRHDPGRHRGRHGGVHAGRHLQRLRHDVHARGLPRPGGRRPEGPLPHRDPGARARHGHGTGTGYQTLCFVDQTTHDMRIGWYTDTYRKTDHGWRLQHAVDDLLAAQRRTAIRARRTTQGARFRRPRTPRTREASAVELAEFKRRSTAGWTSTAQSSRPSSRGSAPSTSRWHSCAR